MKRAAFAARFSAPPPTTATKRNVLVRTTSGAILKMNLSAYWWRAGSESADHSSFLTSTSSSAGSQLSTR